MLNGGNCIFYVSSGVAQRLQLTGWVQSVVTVYLHKNCVTFMLTAVACIEMCECLQLLRGCHLYFLQGWT